MNAIVVTPDIHLFVAAVRERLADLTEEEREELAGGLEADMSDLVAERGVDALPDPAAYAAELRSAAGFEPEMRPVRARVGLGERVTRVLDAAHTRWEALVSGLPGDPWGLVRALRPVWWVLRAWVALQLVDLLWGTGNTGWGLSAIPSLRGWGWLLLAVATAVSVQVGRGRLWPGRPRGGVFGRVLLLVLNVLAIACLPMIVDRVATPASMAARMTGQQSAGAYLQGYDDARSQFDRAGLYADGHWVSNIYPYDAAGHPLVGVQLFDQTGQPVSVRPQTECVYSSDGVTPLDQGRVYYPWTTAAGQVRNVFPVPSRVQGPDVPDPDPMAFAGQDRPQVGSFPLPSVPTASLPGLTVSKATTPADAFVPGAAARVPINPVDQGC